MNIVHCCHLQIIKHQPMTCNELFQQTFSTKQQNFIKGWCKQYGVRFIPFQKAITRPFYNNFEYIHDLLDHSDFKTRSAISYFLQRATMELDHNLFKEIVESRKRFYSMSVENQLSFDVRDAIGITHIDINKNHSMIQIIRVLKKYGLTKCLRFRQYLSSVIPCDYFRNLFNEICEEEPIYGLLCPLSSKNHLEYYMIRKRHKIVLEKIPKYVEFRRYCKTLLTICYEIQNDVVETETRMNSNLFGNDYLLNRVVRFL